MNNNTLANSLSSSILEQRTAWLLVWTHSDDRDIDLLAPAHTLLQDPATKLWLMFHIGNGGEANGSAFMHYASNLNGPWTPLRTTESCSMPTAA